jgi:hypothetical protein
VHSRSNAPLGKSAIGTLFSCESLSYKINFYVDQNGYGGVIANIMLWGSNNRFLGTVNFLDPGSPVPPLAIGDNGTLTVNMPISQFALIVDLLRVAILCCVLCSNRLVRQNLKFLGAHV